MNKLIRIVIVGGLITLSLLFYLIYQGSQEEQSFSGAPIGSECKYVQFTGSIATTTLIQAGQTTLCGVCITEDQAGAGVFKDATSTTAYAIANATQVIDFQAAFTEGCYEINAFIKNNLYMVSADGFSFAGDWTVLFR